MENLIYSWMILWFTFLSLSLILSNSLSLSLSAPNQLCLSWCVSYHSYWSLLLSSPFTNPSSHLPFLILFPFSLSRSSPVISVSLSHGCVCRLCLRLSLSLSLSVSLSLFLRSVSPSPWLVCGPWSGISVATVRPISGPASWVWLEFCVRPGILGFRWEQDVF